MHFLLPSFDTDILSLLGWYPCACSPLPHTPSFLHLSTPHALVVSFSFLPHVLKQIPMDFYSRLTKLVMFSLFSTPNIAVMLCTLRFLLYSSQLGYIFSLIICCTLVRYFVHVFLPHKNSKNYLKKTLYGSSDSKGLISCHTSCPLGYTKNSFLFSVKVTTVLSIATIPITSVTTVQKNDLFNQQV